MRRPRVPHPRWLFYRATVMISAYVIAEIAPGLAAPWQWPAYALASLLLAWALSGMIAHARRHWRRR